MFEVEVNNLQRTLPIDEYPLISVIHAVLDGEGVSSANVSVALVGDDTIHELNAHYLQHNYTTDVLSFVLESGPCHLEGEIVANAEMAARVASDYGWTPSSELTLYVIHGALHLVGYDDQTPAAEKVMRQKESDYLARLQLPPFRVDSNYEKGAAKR